MTGDQQSPQRITEKHDRTDINEEVSNAFEASTKTDLPRKLEPDSKSTERSRMMAAKEAKIVEARSFTLEHDEHRDTINACNEFTYTADHEDVLDFWNDWVLMDEDSWSLDQLYEDRQVQDLLKILTSVSRSTLPSLNGLYGHTSRERRVPLFAGENGNEYHIELSYFMNLPRLSCPSSPATMEWGPDPIQLLRSRVSTDIAPNAVPLPKLVVPLGHLSVRGNTRYPDDVTDEVPITERTDWDVMVDVESESLPVWVFVSRQRLIDRREDANNIAPGPLSLFNGLMTHEKGDYDSACILSSIHQLGQSKESAPAFADVCDMVQKSRCTRDPVLNLLPKGGLDTIAAGGQIEFIYPLTELPERPIAATSHTPSELPKTQSEVLNGKIPDEEPNAPSLVPDSVNQDDKEASTAK